MENLNPMQDPNEERSEGRGRRTPLEVLRNFPAIEYRDRGRLVLTFVTAFVGSVAGKVTVGVATAAIAGVLLWHHRHTHPAFPVESRPQVTHLVGKPRPAQHKHVVTKPTKHDTSKKKSSKRAKTTTSKKKSSSKKKQTRSSSSSRVQNG